MTDRKVFVYLPSETFAPRLSFDPMNEGHFADFRKRPVTIQAMRMDHDFDVETLEGVMHGEAGDWLIRGVAGELYPCKDSIFQQTYEQMDGRHVCCDPNACCEADCATCAYSGGTEQRARRSQ